MTSPLFIGIDAGTSAFKAALVDDHKQCIATAEEPVELLRDGHNVEMATSAYAEAFFRVLKKVSKGNGDAVRAIAISGAAGSTVYTRKDGTHSNIISWLDSRAADKSYPELAGLTSPFIRSITGWPCVTSFPLAHIAWLKNEQPEEFRQVAWIGLCTDFLIYSLCGRHAMDYSTATTMHLVNQVEKRYHADFLNRLSLNQSQLSPLVNNGALVGRITHEAALACNLSPETKVYTGSFDHPSAARGCGVREEGDLLLSCGTSWVAFFPVKDRQWIIEHNFLCDPFESANGGNYAAMFSIAEIGQTIDKYVKQLIAPNSDSPYQVFNEMAAACTKPPTYLDMHAPCPESTTLSTPELAYSVMYSTAKLFADSLTKLNRPFTSAVLTGGPAKSPIWPSIISETTHLQIRVTDNFTGAIGAATPLV